MFGRSEQINCLNQNYNSDKSNLTILYGCHGIGKTRLLNEFLADKNYFYHEAVAGDGFEQINNMAKSVNAGCNDYSGIFNKIYDSGVNLFVIEEFHLLIKGKNGFFEVLSDILKRDKKVMVILSCSSISWVENSMVKTIGRNALLINSFIKLKELNYSDLVNWFPKVDSDTLLKVYGITGGNPLYLSRWNQELSVKDNVCRLFLDKDGVFFKEALNYVRDEFRETGVYNTILSCLAGGKNKLNEIHEYTGYGRDKISVYLKNLIAREIVEKVFSYDFFGNENTKKGLYRIKDAFLEFWYRYIYPSYGVLNVTEPEVFYDRYIEGVIEPFMEKAFIKIAGEFIDIMNEMGRLPFSVTKKGGWHGKNGNIHLIYEDEQGRGIVAQVYVKKEPVSFEDFIELKGNVALAGINAEHYYLFSTAGFLSTLNMDNVETIDIKDL